METSYRGKRGMEWGWEVWVLGEDDLVPVRLLYGLV